MASPATAQTTPISYTAIPISQPSPRMNKTTLDVCIQHITSEKPEYIGLYLHSISYNITSYLIGSIGETSYTWDIPLESWKRVLELTLDENNLTQRLIHGVPTLKHPPKEIYSYIFPITLYHKIGQILIPHFPPPFWDKLNKNNKP